jgi:hypothetical protein
MNLEEAERAIGIAWMAGLVAATMALTIIGISLAGFELIAVTPLALVDVAFMFLLSYGVYRKSRAAALLLLIYYFFSQLLLLFNTGIAASIFIGAVFIYFFFRGFQGTLVYHRQEEP